MSSAPIVLFGCGGHARSVADVVISSHLYERIVFVDANARENETILGMPVVKNLAPLVGDYHFAIGDCRERSRKLDGIGTANLVSVVSSKSHIGSGASCGKGCFVGNFCHIGPEAKIGINVIINNGAIVEHEVEIGNHCHIGPGAAISGRCKLGDFVFVGVGATVKDYIRICSDVTIGAGATVVKDIVERGVYAGTPARRIK